MPFARLTIADPAVSADVQAELAAAITALLEKDLLKEPEVTVFHTNLVPADRWFVDATRLTGTTGAHLEVSITVGTNTAAEKAAFIEHAYELLHDRLGPLPGAVYVALYELDGESYGYNGVTQLARRRLDPGEKD
ncbi:4-oxalocrotonate tautomerase family protein [Nocardia sp. NBC_00511]|uniref:tautomerase family protein n=1 Tax=Nocardia sp. NBC_00511 TaxID=2903591 RepID=UPI0030E54DDA